MVRILNSPPSVMALLSTTWLLFSSPVLAIRRPSTQKTEDRYNSNIRGVNSVKGAEQQQRRLFGERLGTSRDARGGEADRRGSLRSPGSARVADRDR